MTQETRIALLLLGELVAALRANDPDTFKWWLSGGIRDLGKLLLLALQKVKKGFSDIHWLLGEQIQQECKKIPCLTLALAIAHILPFAS